MDPKHFTASHIGDLTKHHDLGNLTKHHNIGDPTKHHVPVVAKVAADARGQSQLRKRAKRCRAEMKRRNIIDAKSFVAWFAEYFDPENPEHLHLVPDMAICLQLKKQS